MKQYNPETGALADYRSLPIAYVLWFLFGLVGGHWFYLKRPAMGILYVCTFGVFGIGWLVDMFNMPDYVRLFNDHAAQEAAPPETRPKFRPSQS